MVDDVKTAKFDRVKNKLMYGQRPYDVYFRSAANRASRSSAGATFSGATTHEDVSN